MAQSEQATKPQGTFVLEISRRFKAPPEAVFNAWTDPHAFSQWMGPPGITARDVKIDLRKSGSYSLIMESAEGGIHPLSGVYREIAPPSRLVFTFIWGFGDLKDMEMLVTLDFAEDKGGTLMTLLQEHVPTQSASDHHNQGWNGAFDCLDSYLAA